jgi:hypothetical protein
MSAYLFPHFNPPESILKKLVSFLGPIKICLPWFMEPSRFFDESPVEILYPPENLKPEYAFITMLSEYRSWIKQNQDRSYIEIIKSNLAGKPREDEIWDIRQMLVRGVASVTDSEDHINTKWHLLLHLAGEIEEQQVSADNLLKTLKEKRSPLEGSIEKALDINSLFGELHALNAESSFTDSNLVEIIKAWLGLFGGYLNKNELLITLNSRIMDYLSEFWDDLSANDILKDWTRVLDIPDLSCNTSNKSEERIKKIRELIIDLGNAPSENLKSLDILHKELGDSFTGALSKATLRCTLKYFFPISDESLLKSQETILKYLSGKTLMLVEEKGTFAE